jgi:colanic acid biosynthesis glycosyl transferase WcaI
VFEKTLAKIFIAVRRVSGYSMKKQYKNKKITLVSQVFYPEMSSTSQLFTSLMEEFTENGWEVEVVCGRIGRASVESDSLHNRMKINRIGISINSNSRIIWRAIGYISFMAGLVKYFLLRRVNSKVIVLTNPPFNPMLFLLISIFRNVSFDLFLLDIYPEGLERLKSGVLKKFIFLPWKKLNKISYRRCDAIYVLGRDMQNLITQDYGISEKKVIYLPHWSAIEPSCTVRFNETKASKRHNLQNKFVVQYSGNMGLWHDIESLVRAANELKEYKSICFHFIGDGIRKIKARNLASELGCDNIIWSPFVPLGDLHDSLSACHVSLISLRPELKGIAVPCKLYGIMASGRPILSAAPEGSELALTLEEFRCGANCRPGDFKSLASEIKKNFHNRDLGETMGSNGYNALKENFLVEHAYHRLIDIWAKY